ncbi:MAG: hypothetical protein Q9226_008424 [Calogaya cf. arnoldii]
MSNNATPLHPPLLAKFRLHTEGRPFDSLGALESMAQVRYSWSPVVDSPGTHGDHYTLVFLNLNINVQLVRADNPVDNEPSIVLKELLNVIDPLAPMAPGASWSVEPFLSCLRALATSGAPSVSNSASRGARTAVFYVTALSLGDTCILFAVRSFMQYSTALSSCSYVLISHNHLSSEATIIEEVHARINFQWLLINKPEQRTLVLVDGHLDLESYLPLYRSVIALGVKVVVLDRPGHWISDSSMKHLYQDFIPIDMAVDDDSPLTHCHSGESIRQVDGICSIASACLTPVAKAATILGLPTEYPDAVACASNKYQARLIAGGAAPTAVVTDVLDLKNQMAVQTFVPRYPLIVKPTMGAGSNHVYKVDTETELLKKVGQTSERSGKRVLVEAYVDGPELDVYSLF